jgi:thiamine-monophosphate kinase
MKSMNEESTLFDLGERRILREIIPRYVSGAGDDCAAIDPQFQNLVVTTDPVPRPAAQVIAGDDDPYWMGWLLVTINASDISAAGARPEAFLAAFDLETHFPVRLFERLLKGVADSCSANGLRYVGGNIREAKTLSAVGTAFGSSPLKSLGRRGAQSGDRIIALGDSGRFWSDAFLVRSGKPVDKTSSPLFSPVSQSKITYHLHEKELLRCATDTSDGLAPTLEELASVNGLKVEVDVASIRAGFKTDAPISRPERLWFGWGDWTVVAAVSPENYSQVAATLSEMSAPWKKIGVFVEGTPGVELLDENRRIRAGRLESERFAADSWFTQGIDEYIRRLENFELP